MSLKRYTLLVIGVLPVWILAVILNTSKWENLSLYSVGLVVALCLIVGVIALKIALKDIK